MERCSPDILLRTLSDDGHIAVRVLVASEVVREAVLRHEARPLAATALGRALMGAILLGSTGKDDESVQLRFRGDGPLGALLAIADCEGNVRGYVSRPGAELPLRGGQLDLPRGVGLGELAVVRHRPGWRHPYTGIVPIVSGEIAEDLALYLSESEQTPSAVGLGVSFEPGGVVGGAAGFLAQALPGASEEQLARLEANVRALTAVSDYARRELGAGEMLAQLLQGIGGRTLGETRPRYHCGCDEARVLRAVAMLGAEDLADAAARGELIEVRCEFCAELYAVDPARAQALPGSVPQ